MNLKHDMDVARLGGVVLAYLKIRELVRTARVGKWTQEQLCERLMQAVGKHETAVLGRIARSFFLANGSVSSKRSHQGWGNARKIWDRFHRLLSSSVDALELDMKTSKNYWNTGSLKRVLLECFRARAIAHTSARYTELMGGKKLRSAVPGENMAWCLYGNQTTKHQCNQDEHDRFVDLYTRLLRNLDKIPVDLAGHGRCQPIDVATVQSAFGTSPFTSYQILGDFAHLTSMTLVTVGPRDLGTGAVLGDVPIDWSELHRVLWEGSTFRTYYKGRIPLLDLGHLVCEVRQNVKSSSRDDLSHFVETFGDPDNCNQRARSADSAHSVNLFVQRYFKFQAERAHWLHHPSAVL